MGVFGLGRRRAQTAEDPLEDAVGEVEDAADEQASTADGSPRARGPWDVTEVPERDKRIDLGALWLPGRDGMQLRMEIEKATQVITGVAVTLNGSTLQVQAFAAPRTDGIWDEIREEIAESVGKQGGSADEIPGPFGRELLARLPVRTAEGRTGHRPARFVGHDGPRWFLRGVLTGRAAIEPDAAVELEDVFADVVVVRGDDARAPRELLALTMPGATRAPVTPSTSEPDLLARGPEITEIR